MKTKIHLRSHLAQFLRIRNVSDKICREIKTHILCSVTFFFFRKGCCLRKKVQKYCTVGQTSDDNTIRHMRITWWINEVTDTHSQYVIPIAFRRQQWFRERASILRLYVHCPSCIIEGLHRFRNLVFYPKSGSCSKKKHKNEYVDLNTK